MNCQKCGTVLETNAAFCPNCGAPVQPQASTQQTTANTGSGATLAGSATSVKSKSTALILEIVAGLFGFLGIGWIYAGQTQKGVIFLVANFVVQGLFFVTTVVGPLCTIPIGVAISAYLLNEHIKKTPGQWS